MNKTKIILFAILIMAVFSGLFILNKDKLALKSELKEIIQPYHGKPGFVIVSFPDFIFSDLVKEKRNDSIDIGKTVKSNRVLYFHENKSLNTHSDSIYKQLIKQMNNKNFVLIEEKDSTDNGTMEIRLRKIKDNWNETTISFCSDSSLLLVNIVNKLPKESIVELSRNLKAEKFNIN